MFAIDCLKANGTHLGTCIDRFYFGSCCLMEPVNEILDNRIETEILDHREPPMRVTNTTIKPVQSTEKIGDNIISFITNDIENKPMTTQKYSQNISPEKPATISLIPTTTASVTIKNPTFVLPELTFGQKISTLRPTTFTKRPTTISSIQTTTDSQKLQTFQIIDGSSFTETSIPTSSLTFTTIKLNTIGADSISKVTSVATSTTKTATTKPSQTKPLPTKPSRPKPSTSKGTAKPKPVKPFGKYKHISVK